MTPPQPPPPSAASRPLRVRGCRLIVLHRPAVDGACISVLGQDGCALPFAVERLFVTHDVPAGATRGRHAHRQCHQLLVCVAGAVTVTVDDGTVSEEVALDHPGVALHVPPMVWAEQRHEHAGSVLVVAASHRYDEGDYIREPAAWRAALAALAG